MSTTFYPETLPQDTTKLAEHITATQPSFLRFFYLSGGTGLSLQIGY